MELAAQEVRMVRDFDDLNVSPVWRGAGDAQAAAGQYRFIFAVELIAMAMALAYLCCAVGFCRLAIRLKFACPRAQTHCASQFIDAGQLAQLINDAVGGGLIEFAGVCFVQPAYVASKLNARSLHAQANT